MCAYDVLPCPRTHCSLGLKLPDNNPILTMLDNNFSDNLPDGESSVRPPSSVLSCTRLSWPLSVVSVDLRLCWKSEVCRTL